MALMAAREIVCSRSSVPASALVGVVAVSPFTLHPDNVPSTIRASYTSYVEYGQGAPVIDRSVMAEFFRAANMDRTNRQGFFLLDDEGYSNFPRVYISTAECDPLRDDGKVLASALKDAGVSVREHCYLGLPHCFWFFNTLPEWSTFITNTASAIQWATSE